MSRYRTLKYAALAVVVGSAVVCAFPRSADAQVDGPLIYLQRGQLWNSYYYGKTAPPFNNWQRQDYGMDWPGFVPEELGVDIGGPSTHLLSGGFWFSGLDSDGRVIATDDFGMYAFSTADEPGAKYRIQRHEKVYKNGANHFGAANPEDAEDYVVSEWQANPNWRPQWEGDRQHPIHVRREVRQWGGFAREQNYILLDYTLTNISDSTIYDSYVLLSYAFTVNSRSWSTLAQGYPGGSRNTRQLFNPAQRLLFAWAIDTPELEGDQGYGYYPNGGPNRQGEFLAPAYVGVKVLGVSPNDMGQADRVNAWGWVKADPLQDQQGPFRGLAGEDGFQLRYNLFRNPASGPNSVLSPGDPAWGLNRMWSLLSLGPFTIGPGESIEFAWAEVIGGVDYDVTIDPQSPPSAIGQGLRRMETNAQRAQWTYDQGYNVPKPPPAPPVRVSLFDAVGVIANVVKWDDTYDHWQDPDYSAPDAQALAGYRLYRSNYLPHGPWELVKDIPKRDVTLFDASTGTYTVVDSTVTQGFSYYYALTAYNTGADHWPPRPEARFPETNSNAVPPLESSLFANRTQQPFRATIPAVPGESDLDVIVVPNPFVARSGFLNPRDHDVIQFINLPSPATIRIYTMRGTLVKTIEHDDGSGIAFWDQVTDFGQYVKSGVYVYHVETPEGGAFRSKFAIIR